MAKPKAKSTPQTSAAQRREQVRQQRQERINTAQNTQARRRTSRKADKSSPWPLIGGILLMVVIVIGIFFYLSYQNQAATTQGANEALKGITSISPSLLAQVSTGSAQPSLHALPSNAQIPKGPNGKPQFLYIGADYCPYCAAQRWAIIVALSRFGTFGPLEPLVSSESNIPTFTFHGAKYTSQYIDFVAVETEDNNRNSLDQLTSQQQQLFNTFNAPPYTSASAQGGIPFLLIGNKQTSSGAFYNPLLLSDMTYPDIAKQINNPSSDISKGILGSANYLTAAICQATQNQPASVCNADPIPQIQASLPKPTSVVPAGPPLALAAAPTDIIGRRQD